MEKNVIAKQLKGSPLFALSLSGKEIAHSNFWKWLIDLKFEGEKSHPFVEVFIKDFYKNKFVLENVEREKGYRDITINYMDGADNKCYVIENKLKAIPELSQLIDYEDALDKDAFVRGILTGITPTLDISSMGKWEFMDYETIAKSIRTICNQIYDEEENSNRIVIEQYCKDIENISNLIKEEIQCSNKKYMPEADPGLEEIRLADIFLKFKGSEFAAYLNEQIKNNELKLKSKYWGLPEAEASFHNKKPTITVIYKYLEPSEQKKENELGRIGIQIEGKQFRIYGGPSKSGSILKDKDNLYSKFKELGWFEDYNPGNKKLDGKETGMRKEYCQYTTATYTHLYQYWIIEDCSYEQLRKQIFEKLKAAKDLIDSGKIKF